LGRWRQTGTRPAVVAATPDRWSDLEAVFGLRGDPARCWCQWFFDGASIGPGLVGAANKAALQAQIEAGPAPGLIAYLGADPVGWVAVGPRSRYGRLQRSTILPATSPQAFTDASIWSITCFVVRVGYRRLGVARALVLGAVDHARRAGATAIEAYPVDPSSKLSVSASELYHGTLSIFVAAGFTEVARPRPARPVVRLPVTPRSETARIKGVGCP
jgi:ribosomal protein S18 acetylase RimI-like enzyme